MKGQLTTVFFGLDILVACAGAGAAMMGEAGGVS